MNALLHLFVQIERAAVGIGTATLQDNLLVPWSVLRVYKNPSSWNGRKTINELEDQVFLCGRSTQETI